MTSAQAYSYLFNGQGYVYVTGASGVFPTVDTQRIAYAFPLYATPNTIAYTSQIKSFGLASVAETGSGYGMFTVQFLTAAAGNINNLPVDGVNQITGVVAITVGDPEQTAADLAANINATIATPDYRAFSVGDTVYGIPVLPGSLYNGDVVTMATTGISTYEITDVAGGRTAGENPIRIWIDIDPAATDEVPTANWVEITDWLTYRGTISPRPSATASIVTGAVVVDRLAADMDVYVTNTDTLSSIVLNGALDGDILTIHAVAGQTVTVTTNPPDMALAMATVILDTPEKSIAFKYSTSLGWVEVGHSNLSAADLAILDPTIPSTTGTEIVTVGAGGGTFTMVPLQTGVVPPNTTYKNNITLDTAGTVTLLANFSIVIDIFAGAQAGMGGIISGGVSSIDLNGNSVDIILNGVATSTLPAQVALTGMWSFVWSYDGSNTVGALNPNWGGNTVDIILTPMIKDLNVTNDKIATVEGSKIITETTPITALDLATQAKINRGAPTVVNTALVIYAGLDNNIINADASAADILVEVDLTLGATQVITVSKVDNSTFTVTVQDVNGALIASSPLWVLRSQWNSITIVSNATGWTITEIVGLSRVTTNVDYTAIVSDDIITVTGGTIFTLPPASEMFKPIIWKAEASSGIAGDIFPDGASTIDGAVNIPFVSPDSITITSDGTNYQIN